MDDARINELITGALSNKLGPGRFEIISIACLDPHLQGHAFKYHQGSGNIAGINLITNRLPLMMIVTFVAHKRQHAAAAYVRAHRLLSYLT